MKQHNNAVQIEQSPLNGAIPVRPRAQEARRPSESVLRSVEVDEIVECLDRAFADEPGRPPAPAPEKRRGPPPLPKLVLAKGASDENDKITVRAPPTSQDLRNVRVPPPPLVPRGLWAPEMASEAALGPGLSAEEKKTLGTTRPDLRRLGRAVRERAEGESESRGPISVQSGVRVVEIPRSARKPEPALPSVIVQTQAKSADPGSVAPVAGPSRISVTEILASDLEDDGPPTPKSPGGVVAPEVAIKVVAKEPVRLDGPATQRVVARGGKSRWRTISSVGVALVASVVIAAWGARAVGPAGQSARGRAPAASAAVPSSPAAAPSSASESREAPPTQERPKVAARGPERAPPAASASAPAPVASGPSANDAPAKKGVAPQAPKTKASSMASTADGGTAPAQAKGAIRGRILGDEEEEQ